MEILKILELSGPNIWTNRYVLETWVDLGPYEEKPSNLLPGFYDQLISWLPSLIEHRCSEGERGGFLSRLRDGTWLGHILEHVTLELQTLVYAPVGYGRARETTDRGVYRVVFATLEPELARACMATARRLLLAAAEHTPFDFPKELAALQQVADRVCLSPFGRALLLAAKARNVPFRRLGPLALLGYGVEQRRIHGEHSDCTSALGATLVEDPALSSEILRQVGISVVPAGERLTQPRYTIWVVGDSVLGVLGDLALNGAARFSETVHPDVEQLALLAARTLGLRVAAVELTLKDINLPLDKQNVSVVRVDSRFDWESAHKLAPALEARAAEAMLDELMPKENADRFKLVSVSGTNGKSDVAARMKALLAALGHRVGHADQHDDLETNQPVHAHSSRVFINPLLDSAVVEVSETGVLEQGAPFDYASVAIVTNLGEGDHLGKQYLETSDFARKAVRTPVDVVKTNGCAVLNADDATVRDLAQHSDGKVVFFSSGKPDWELKVEEVPLLGWCYLDGGRVWAGWDAASCEVIVENTASQGAGWRIENALAAVSAGWVLGADVALLQRIWDMQDSSVQQTSVAQRSALLANARNPAALKSWLAEVNVQTPLANCALVLCVASDWRDADATEMGRLAASCSAWALVCDVSSGARGTALAQLVREAAMTQSGTSGKEAETPKVFGNLAAAAAALPGSKQLLVQTRTRGETISVIASA